MKSAPFVLHRPRSLAAAISLLSQYHEEGGLVLAGGQSLIPMMALRVAYPPHLIDINTVEGLDRVATTDDRLVIGATVRHVCFQRPVVSGTLGNLLSEVSRHIGHYPIRNRGTFCGSIAHADPSSEWCLVAITLDAEIRLVSAAADRSVPAREFFSGAMATVRRSNEIIVEVTLPILGGSSTFGFYEFNRRAGDFAIGMCLVTFDLRGGKMHHTRVAIGGIEESPRRLPDVEMALENAAPKAETFAKAAALASNEVDPMEDATTSAEYRRGLTAVVVRRALESAIAHNPAYSVIGTDK